MAILKLENGDVLSENFPVHKAAVMTVGHILDFKKEPSYKVEKTPDWYKKIQSRTFEIVQIQAKCGWANGGFSTGFQLDVEYIVKEISNQ